MSLFQLQQLASHQQEQIECQERFLANREKQLNYLSTMMKVDCHQQRGPKSFHNDQTYDQNLNFFKEKISLQEVKLRKLRLIKDQIQKQRYVNSNFGKFFVSFSISFFFSSSQNFFTDFISFCELELIIRLFRESSKMNTMRLLMMMLSMMR